MERQATCHPRRDPAARRSGADSIGVPGFAAVEVSRRVIRIRSERRSPRCDRDSRVWVPRHRGQKTRTPAWASRS